MNMTTLEQIIAEEQKKFEEQIKIWHLDHYEGETAVVKSFLSASATRVALATRDAMVVEEKEQEDILSATLAWHDELLDTDKPCIMCGVIPDNIKKMAKLLVSARTQSLKQAEEFLNEK